MRLDATASVVTLSIDDDGAGVSVVDREQVFDRFTRLDDARSRTSGGSGLGLTIVKQVVDDRGGTVGFDDAEHGARVVVTLPAD